MVNFDLNCLSQGTEYVFTFDGLLRHSRPGVSQKLLTPYPHNQELCVVTFLKKYIQDTESLCDGETILFLSYVKPQKRISTDTFGRWIKTVMMLAGIDTTIFKAHGCRAASTSKAHGANVPVDVVLQTAGWSRADTFSIFYNKPISNMLVFADRVLDFD